MQFIFYYAILHSDSKLQYYLKSLIHFCKNVWGPWNKTPEKTHIHARICMCVCMVLCTCSSVISQDQHESRQCLHLGKRPWAGVPMRDMTELAGEQGTFGTRRWWRGYLQFKDCFTNVEATTYDLSMCMPSTWILKWKKRNQRVKSMLAFKGMVGFYFSQSIFLASLNKSPYRYCYYNVIIDMMYLEIK